MTWKEYHPNGYLHMPDLTILHFSSSIISLHRIYFNPVLHCRNLPNRKPKHLMKAPAGRNSKKLEKKTEKCKRSKAIIITKEERNEQMSTDKKRMTIYKLKFCPDIFWNSSVLLVGCRALFKQWDITQVASNYKKYAKSRITPRPGIEPGSSAWQAEILTTILPRMSC